MSFTRILTAAAIALSCTAASAQTVSVPQAEGSDEGSVAIGGAILSSPDYVGADETQFLILPYIDVYNYKGFDFVPFTGSYALVDYLSGDGLWAWGIKAGPQLNYEFGRPEDDADELEGLGDLGGSLYGGGYARVRLGPVGLRLEGGQDLIDGTGGQKFDATIGTRLPIGDGSLTAGLTANWGSEDYNQSYFGITADQAAATSFTQTDVTDGVYANTATLLLQYPMKKDWEITALASYRKYVDEIENSPLIAADTGSADGLTLLFGVAKRFDFKNK